VPFLFFSYFPISQFSIVYIIFIYEMKKLFALLTVLSLFVSSAFSIDVKNLNVQTEYKLTRSDSGYLLAINSPTNRIVKIVVPFERTTVFSTGAEISGLAMTDGTIQISSENNDVIILQPDSAYRTRKMGSTFKLTRVSRNFWVLDGDLYSLEVDAYVGEELTIRANVDPNATGPLRFVWYKNNVVLPGKTTSTLKFPSVTTSDSGNYRVDASNSAGLVKSETTNLLVR
jgi:hypothetical protein